MNSKRLELASNLAHNATLHELSDLYTENELWVEINGGMVYKEDVQDVFNAHYDYFLGEVEKVFTEPTVIVIPSIFIPDDKVIETITDAEINSLLSLKQAKSYSLSEFLENFNKETDICKATDFIKII